MLVLNNYTTATLSSARRLKSIPKLRACVVHAHAGTNTEYINTHQHTHTHTQRTHIAWTGAAGLELPVFSCFMSLALEIASTDKRTVGYSLMHFFFI